MRINVIFEDDKNDIYEEMPNFSKWLSENNLIPNIGDGFFVSDEEIKGFEKESKYANSTEWIVTHKFFEPHFNTILILCRCINDVGWRSGF